MARRQRSDSIAAQVAVAGAAGKPIVPPAHVPLAAEDMVFFASVIDEFPRSEWTGHQLELAALLARDMADAARIQVKRREEGETFIQPTGTMVPHPLLASLRMKTTNIMAMRRSLASETRPAARSRAAVTVAPTRPSPAMPWS